MLECRQDTWRVHTQINSRICPNNPTHPEGLRWAVLELRAARAAAALQNSLFFPNFLVIQDEPSENLAALSVPEGIPTHLPKQGFPKERKIGKIPTPKDKENGEFPRNRQFLWFLLGFVHPFLVGSWRQGGTSLGYLRAFFCMN